MTITTKLLIAVSALLLTHSVYSAHEHSSLSAASTQQQRQLPADVVLETLAGAWLLMLGIVAAAAGDLRPVHLAAWAGLLQREKGAGPWAFLDECAPAGGFWDVRKSRDEFRLWAVGQGRRDAL